MDDRFGFLYKNRTAGINLEELRTQALAEVKTNDNNILAMVKDYEAHLASLTEISFAKTLESFGLRMEKSTGGHPQVSIGEGRILPNGKEALFLAENAIASLNAIASVAARKYQLTSDDEEPQIEAGFHLAWFDPRRNAEGVVSALQNGEWEFFDWKGGRIVKSTMSDQRRKFQTAKHEAIDNILFCNRFKTKYAIVLNGDREYQHYEERIKGRIEMSLAEVHEALALDGQAYKMNRALLLGAGVTQNPSKPADRSSLIEKIVPGVTLITEGGGAEVKVEVTDSNVDDLRLNIQGLPPAWNVSVA